MNEVLEGWPVVFFHEAIQISDHGFSWTANIFELKFNKITKLKLFLTNSSTDQQAYKGQCD